MRPVQARLSPQAEADLDEILLWSEEHFGHGAAVRYAELIVQALYDLEADPRRAGTARRPELPLDVLTYHLSSSRGRVAAAHRVKTPRHFLAYRIDADRIDVLRILHDSRDLARHLPEG